MWLKCLSFGYLSESERQEAVQLSLALQAPAPGDALVVLGAAKLGATRLIDNLEV